MCTRPELEFITNAMKTESTSMYSENYSEHLRNYGEL
ncbi:hypothetical protein T12_6087 [Trichinella patagoniensis]|uniref:Uncharacterized protein n=1 Tax=Trichinella patagoniensis TaxID=990121 RepID=A0A0V0Z0R1_9BILA|nr:hypothetical protein T12_6087 [Trichinella patagoniensis]